MSLTEFQPAYLALNAKGDVVVARFTRPNLSEEENVEQLGHELFSLVDQFDCRKVVLDLGGVQFVTSSVLGKMITLHRKLHRKEGLLVICNVGGSVAGVMRTSRLLDYFNVADDVDGAMGRLENRRNS
jgi:anti-sigma B factor antagonist